MLTEELLEEPTEELQEVSALKPEVKKKQNYFSIEDIVLMVTSLGISTLFILLILVFGISIPPGWTMFP
jgi:hypothetical protein